MMIPDMFTNYVEALVLDEEGNEKIVTKEVTACNPLYIKYDTNVIAFRFFRSAFDSTRVDYSNWFFNGEELSISRFVLRYGDNLAFRRYMADINKFGAYKVCVIPNGSVYVMGQNDRAVRELRAHLSEKEAQECELYAESINVTSDNMKDAPVELIRKLF